MANIKKLLKAEERIIKEKLKSEDKLKILGLIKKQKRLEESETKEDPGLEAIAKEREHILDEQIKLLEKEEKIEKVREKIKEELKLTEKIEKYEKEKKKGKELEKVAGEKAGGRKIALAITFILVSMYLIVSCTTTKEFKLNVVDDYYIIIKTQNLNSTSVAISAEKNKNAIFSLASILNKDVKTICDETDINKDKKISEYELRFIFKKYNYTALK